MWIGNGIATFVLGLVVVGRIQAARLRKALAGRDEGVGPFATSLGRTPDEVVVAATFSAIVAETGEAGARVRADDDLGRLFGVVDDDFDDLVLAAITGAGLTPPQSAHLRLRSPRDIIAFLDTLHGPVAP